MHSKSATVAALALAAAGAQAQQFPSSSSSSSSSRSSTRTSSSASPSSTTLSRVGHPGTDWTQVYDPSVVPSENATAEVHTRNLTPDGYWHNRYHGLLSMAAYGDYNTLCPIQTFTEEAKLRNFPESDREPWVVVNTFGPTASGANGFTAIVPEMNKALIIFAGNYQLEQTLTDEVVSWDYLGLGDYCRNCTVNKFAADGYLEAKAETNDWAAILGEYYNTGLVFSIAGHGLGGMHSQIASVDLNSQGHCWYSHAYGSPRVFNQAGADRYNQAFNGEAGERGVFGQDDFSEHIPAGPNYAHAGTTFYYWGLNSTSGNPNWHICWDDAEDPECKPGAQPEPWDLTPAQAKYYYFSTVGECGGRTRPNTTIINTFLESNGEIVEIDSEYATPSGTPAASSTSSVRRQSQQAGPTTPAAAGPGAPSTRSYAYPPSYSSSP